MNQDFYIALLKRRESCLIQISNDLKTMYAVPGGWASHHVANINVEIEKHNLEVRHWCPDCPELLIKIVLLGSNS